MAEENDFSSFDENAWKAQDAADDREIAKLLGDSQNNGGGIVLDNVAFDQSGKADDAEDYEDISDDDLPDEEEPSAGVSMEMPGLTDDGGTSHDPDDLFGEGPSSPDPILGPSSPAPHIRDADTTDDTQPLDTSLSFPGINFDPEPHLDNQDPDIPAPAETVEDLLKATWPAFKKGHILTWSELLPAKKATWKEKKPVKKPKQLVTSKLTLELAPDQEKLFRIPGTATITRKPRQGEERGLVYCGMDQEDQAEDNVQFDLDQESDSETVAGFTLRDIELACEDWGASIETIEADFKARQTAEQQEQQARKRVFEEQDEEWDAEFLMDLGDEGPSRPKKRKTVKLGLPEIPRYAAPSFDNFEDATRRGAKRVQLDMSDPYLLIETQETQRNAKRPRTDNKLKRMANGNLGRDVSNRFNISNDEAYEALKENHQSKVRATLGNISVEHSMPAIKLSWPYYKVKLGGTTDEYHRPRFRYKKFAGHIIKFDKPAHQKRKQMKGKAHEVFLKSKDLSINDNSTAVLYEYCEQRPRVLSSFGMGNRLINYYRRKDTNEDEQLPKQELGEYRMLLPEDRSPFSLFGTVDPGETVPTLHNEMYRAPVFKHNPRGSDFLVVRSTTGEHGSRWFLHKIDHLYVVGQQFPSVEVPGPHSRKVTNASKNRMKMLAFRMIRHSDTDNCQLSDITKHIADSTDTQNRQKLKEFLQYDRESGEKGMWRLKPGEILPDESTIRSMIKPEEVCLLDAMQLGIKELEDAGYDPRNASLDEDVQNNDADGDDDDVEDEGSKIAKGAKKQQEKQEETLADKMAPWKTTKAFIDACAQKAMLQLHGEGDPTGHGLGFSFIRTSMKGGYIEAVQGPLATSADAMEREKRANGGHAYNVKKQQAMYEEGIREIWEKQKSTLSDGQEHDDKDVAVTEDEDDRFNVQSAMTPAQFDDGTSQISGLTSASRQQRRAIRITREIRMPDGSTQDRVEVVHDPVVISQYMKRRTEADLEMRDIYSSRPTGNADHDRLAGIRIKKELERLEKNKARRQAREQQKELHQKASTGDAGSPSVNGDKVPTGTTRKCANCGQVGHIKTNKKYEPPFSIITSLCFSPSPMSFNWCAPLEADNTKRSRSRKSQLQLAMEQCDKDKARDARRRAEEKAREGKAIARQLEQERRATEKEAERERRDAAAKRQKEEREAKAQRVQEQRAAEVKRREEEKAERKRVKEELQRRARERRAREQEIARARREAERIRRAWKVPRWRSGGAWR
ncbi:putative transcription initiation factor TFIID 111 kDa subunit [Fusarium oxysporum f. sp. raphani]|uniref:Putative transcription initiation factor TFIID 111 kDa subunit n=1 Tax=Fusarium oxysporum f. sp. raphani TaxID=96318 RepID=A0A8J5Q4Z3_FUSOX|nr:putative transcription initiation factor TFIID 111 kDa subunit [Fusarium oxysporum f. sp. raphani]